MSVVAKSSCRRISSSTNALIVLSSVSTALQFFLTVSTRSWLKVKGLGVSELNTHLLCALCSSDCSSTPHTFTVGSDVNVVRGRSRGILRGFAPSGRREAFSVVRLNRWCCFHRAGKRRCNELWVGETASRLASMLR